ncbi:MAG: lysylphosphatidylglycerol synthase transmembrane domain-containing protein, partial [Gammaproteobacteria bacterium]
MTPSPKLIRQVIVWLVIGVALYGGIVVFSGYDEVTTALGSIGIGGWLTVLALSSLNIVVRFLRWHMYISALGHRVPWFKNLQYFIAGFAFTSTPAKAGEAVRSIYLKRHDVRYSESLAALFVERLTDLLAVVLCALAAALAFADWRWLVYAAGIGTLTILPLVRSQAVRSLLLKLKERSNSARISNGLGHLVALLNSSAALLRAGPLYGGM